MHLYTPPRTDGEAELGARGLVPRAVHRAAHASVQRLQGDLRQGEEEESRNPAQGQIRKQGERSHDRALLGFAAFDT